MTRFSAVIVFVAIFFCEAGGSVPPQRSNLLKSSTLDTSFPRVGRPATAAGNSKVDPFSQRLHAWASVRKAGFASSTPTPTPQASTQSRSGGRSDGPTASPTPSFGPSPTKSPYGNVLIGEFSKLDLTIPVSSCPVFTTRYEQVVQTENKKLRIPHSRMFMNGHRCGDLGPNATMDELLLDSFMELMPMDELVSEQVAEEHGHLAAYRKLASGRPYVRSFFNFSVHERLNHPTAEPQTWVGYERFTNRTCGTGDEQVTLGAESLVFIGQAADVLIGLDGLVPRFQGSGLVLDVGVPFHVSFSRANGDEPEHVCPSVVRGVSDRDAGGAKQCFPGSARVELADGRRVGMGRVAVGDRVRDASGAFSEVFAFSHADAHADATFVRVRTSGGRAVTLTRGHLLQTGRGLRAAGDVGVGERVGSVAGWERVTAVETVRATGLYNAHTLSGTVAVDGVHASCYTTAVAAVAAHALLAPVRLAYRAGRRSGAVRAALREWMRDGGDGGALGRVLRAAGAVRRAREAARGGARAQRAASRGLPLVPLVPLAAGGLHAHAHAAQDRQRRAAAGFGLARKALEARLRT